MSDLPELHPNERVICRVRATHGTITGTLVVTLEGVYFYKYTDWQHENLLLFHRFNFNEISGFRIEKYGLVKSLSKTVMIAFDQRSAVLRRRTFRYLCERDDADRVLKSIKTVKEMMWASSELESIVFGLVRPRGEINLKDIAANHEVKSLLARIISDDDISKAKEYLFKVVESTVAKLITEGKLDGIITEDSRFVSQTVLAQKSVQYQIVIDFAAIHSRLKSKGILLQTLECPSCQGNIDYPEKGDRIVCSYCGANIQAIDIFERFKNMI